MVKVYTTAERRKKELIPSSGVAVSPGRALLLGMVGYWDVADYSGAGNWLNLGTGGSALDFVLGASTAAPEYVPYTSTKYWHFTQNASNANNSYLYCPPATVAPPSADAIVLKVHFKPLALTFTTGQIMLWSSTVGGTSGGGVSIGTNGSKVVARVHNGATSSILDAGTTHTPAGAGPGAGVEQWWRVTVDAAGANILMESSLDGTNWTTELNAAIAGGTYKYPVGNVQGFFGGYSTVPGDYYDFSVTVGGVTWVDFSAANANNTGDSPTQTANSKTVTLARGGRTNYFTSTGHATQLVDEKMWLFDGTNDVMTIADNALLDFAAAESLSWGFVFHTTSYNGSDSYLTKGSNPQYFLGHDVTTFNNRVKATIYDGAASTSAVNGDYTTMQKTAIMAVRSVPADTLTVFRSGTTGTPVTDATTATLENTGSLQIGIARMELFGAFVHRGVLTSSDLAAIRTYFGAV